MEKKNNFIQKTGRRKTSTARVRLLKGKGNITVNDKKFEDYFSDIKNAKDKITQPLVLIGKADKYDITVKVSGGGKHAQLQAVVMGLSRSLVSEDEVLRATLKKNGFLSRDPRMKERKKYGLKRARKATQYRKR